MKLKFKNIYITIEETFIIFVIVWGLSPYIRSFFDGYVLCYFFIIFHECAHVLVAGIVGNNLMKINVRLCGINAVIKKTNELHPKWLLIYLAGPISNWILALLFYDIEIVRDINLGLSLINLLPVSPLDGYNVLNILLYWFLPNNKVKKLICFIQKIVLTLILLIGIIIFFRFKNPSIIIFYIYVIFIII